jgi:alpha-N-arabinofuranosidase
VTAPATSLGTIRTGDPVGEVHPRLFGAFVEHMGRCVYTGIYEPGHPRADASGFREDVIDLVRELGVTVVRYPGGNFVSGYRWEDGVGPQHERPRRLNLAWHTTETNEFGLDEFVRWAARAGVEPMLAVNLGTRGIDEAVALLEYANVSGGTARSDDRIANGSDAPYDIRMWCLGNEMDGPWQLGHKTADEYGRIAAETARAMRMLDKDLELVACGSSGGWMPTFIEWERTVLEHTYDLVDYVSLHAYFEEDEAGDLASFLASGVKLDRFIDSVIAAADGVGAALGSEKRIQVSVDEWNVWYLRRFEAQPLPADWPAAPPLAEDDYSVADAVVVGALLISLLRHADRVTCACLAQLVNAISPIRAEAGGPAWRQTTFYPFSLTARHAAGTVVPVRLEVPLLDTAAHGPIPAVDAIATYDEAAGAVSVFLVNRSPDETVSLELTVDGPAGLRVIEHVVLADDDPYARNTSETPTRVEPRQVPLAAAVDGRHAVTLPPVSWSMLRLEAGQPDGGEPT